MSRQRSDSRPVEAHQIRSVTFATIESHTAGNPTRTVLSGVPPLAGETMLERMDDLATNHDWIRTALMFEPRGSSIMSGCLLMEPCDPAADLGVLFIEASGHLPMCGHDTIGLVTALIETGRWPVLPAGAGDVGTGPHARTVDITLDTPAGLIHTHAEVVDGKVTSVSFVSPDSFLLHEGVTVDLPGVGAVSVDIAWGGTSTRSSMQRTYLSTWTTHLPVIASR